LAKKSIAVTEPIHERDHSSTLRPDNAVKPPGEAEVPLRLHNTPGGAYFLEHVFYELR
jgi:hypothetical protein